MKRGMDTDSNATKARRKKSLKRRRRTAQTAARHKRSSVTDLRAQLAHTKGELEEALQREAATGEILASISGSISDARPVFDAIVHNLRRLLGTQFAAVQLVKDGMVHLAAATDAREFAKMADQFPRLVDDLTGGGRAILSKQVVQYAPIVNNPAAPPINQQWAREFGFDAAIFAPMIREGMVVGAIATARKQAKPFDDRQVALIKVFADQAVIAIENARMFGEVRARTDDLTEALEQQTATADVLQVISSSPGELEPVFHAMLENAVRICDAKFGVMWRCDGGEPYPVAMLNLPPEVDEFLRHRGRRKPTSGSDLDVLCKSKQSVHTLDMAAALHPTRIAKVAGVRTQIAVPMLKNDELVGAVTIYRQEVRPFSEKQIEVVRNFAAQAVIAIENTRLLNELRESLQQQTATSEVLKVISSSPGELNPVFDSLLSNATNICDAKFGNLFMYRDGVFILVAMHNAPAAYAEARRRAPVRPPLGTGLGQVAITKQVAHVTDLMAEQAYVDRDPFAVQGVELGGIRTLLAVPMLKDDQLVGGIVIYRQEVRPFTDKQIALVQNFAAQAVIAIENTRLLNELRQRTDDLTESLEQQTATSEVLQVISSSSGNLQLVFDSVLKNATGISGSGFGMLWLSEGDGWHPVAMHGVPSVLAEERAYEGVLRFGPDIPISRSAGL
jgi:GAF domain-containing protein